jgi:hypothetical protein
MISVRLEHYLTNVNWFYQSNFRQVPDGKRRLEPM